MTLAKIFNISVAELLADETDIHNVADSATTFTPAKKNASHIYDLDRDEMSLGRLLPCRQLPDQKKK